MLIAAEERIWTVDGDRAFAHERNRDELRVAKAVSLPFVADRVWSAPSGRHLAARRADGAEVCVLDLERGVVTSSVATTVAGKQQIVATVAVVGDRELLICARNASELEAFALGSGERQWRADCETFRFTDFVPSDRASAVIGVGFFAGETKDSLAAIDLARAERSPGDLFDQFRRKAAVGDYAYRLRVGPAGGIAFAAFRDPEDDEDEPDGGGDPLHGFRGLYVREVTGSVLAMVPWNGPSIRALAAGSIWIAVDADDGIHLVARASPHELRSEPGRWVACSRAGGYVVVERGGAWVRIDLDH